MKTSSLPFKFIVVRTKYFLHCFCSSLICILNTRYACLVIVRLVKNYISEIILRPNSTFHLSILSCFLIDYYCTVYIYCFIFLFSFFFFFYFFSVCWSKYKFFGFVGLVIFFEGPINHRRYILPSSIQKCVVFSKLIIVIINKNFGLKSYTAKN